MATVSEDSDSSRSLITELFAGAIYKQKQGRIVRQVTCLAIWLTVWLGGWQLYEVIGSGLYGINNWASFRTIQFLLPGVLTAAGMWFAFRLVNWPRFAKFLIEVEAEMTKVSWPNKTELYRASMVCIFTMAFLAVILFAFDLVWQAIFDFIGVS
ncbi:MAG: preprotein translocase subunit SecE [Pirellula sp.]